jgi:cyclohexadienyl dehydratase
MTRQPLLPAGQCGRHYDAARRYPFLIVALLLCMVNFVLALALRSKPVQQSALERVLRTGILRVGTPADYAPFSLVRCDGTGVCGSDIDDMHSLAASLGSSVSVVRIPWSDLTLASKAGKFDIAVGGIDATLSRRRLVDFSVGVRPEEGKAVVALCGGYELGLMAAQSSGTDALANLDSPSLVVAVNRGGTNEQLIRSFLQLASIEVVRHNGEQFGLVMQGVANLTVTDIAEAQYMSMRHPKLCYSAALTRATKVPSNIRCAEGSCNVDVLAVADCTIARRVHRVALGVHSHCCRPTYFHRTICVGDLT